jgi:hypothetical protein
MNIDERIEALTTRQEGFSQSLELMSRIQQDSFEEHQKKLDQLERIAGVALDSIQRLERIAVADEERIGHIEDQG